MQGDFDRVTFNKRSRFANVLLQQGRLLLPADFNEQAAILHHFIRSFIVDQAGRSFAAKGDFAITVASPAQNDLKIKIGKGRFYVDGIMCENHIDRSYDDQPLWPKSESLADLKSLEDKKDQHAVVYLDCWERHVTWLNYARLRDPALGGPDTATRVQIAWQVRAQWTTLASELDKVIEALGLRQDSTTDPDEKKALGDLIDKVKKTKDLFKAPPITKENAQEILDALDSARPRMTADAKSDSAALDPCAIAPDAEYRGRENQLYRVEVHEPGLAGTATFKWSRENGSVAFKVLDAAASPAETQVTVESLGHDRRTGLSEGDWVELTDDQVEFAGKVRPLQQVRKIDVARRLVTLTGQTEPGKVEPAVDPVHHAILRRWDHETDGKAKGAILVNESTEDTGWIYLERGVKIRFAPGSLYRKGDYWLITARQTTGDVEWPADGEKPRAIGPHGISHHRAPLAIVNKSAKGWE
jgi:hypothetical protein